MCANQARTVNSTFIETACTNHRWQLPSQPHMRSSCLAPSIPSLRSPRSKWISTIHAVHVRGCMNPGGRRIWVPMMCRGTKDESDSEDLLSWNELDSNNFNPTEHRSDLFERFLDEQEKRRGEDGRKDRKRGSDDDDEELDPDDMDAFYDGDGREEGSEALKVDDEMLIENALASYGQMWNSRGSRHIKSKLMGHRYIMIRDPAEIYQSKLVQKKNFIGQIIRATRKCCPFYFTGQVNTSSRSIMQLIAFGIKSEDAAFAFEYLSVYRIKKSLLDRVDAQRDEEEEEEEEEDNDHDFDDHDDNDDNDNSSANWERLVNSSKENIPSLIAHFENLFNSGSKKDVLRSIIPALLQKTNALTKMLFVPLIHLSYFLGYGYSAIYQFPLSEELAHGLGLWCSSAYKIPSKYNNTLHPEYMANFDEEEYRDLELRYEEDRPDYSDPYFAAAELVSDVPRISIRTALQKLKNELPKVQVILEKHPRIIDLEARLQVAFDAKDTRVFRRLRKEHLFSSYCWSDDFLQISAILEWSAFQDSFVHLRFRVYEGDVVLDDLAEHAVMLFAYRPTSLTLHCVEAIHAYRVLETVLVGNGDKDRTLGVRLKIFDDLWCMLAATYVLCDMPDMWLVPNLAKKSSDLFGDLSHIEWRALVFDCVETFLVANEDPQSLTQTQRQIPSQSQSISSGGQRFEMAVSALFCFYAEKRRYQDIPYEIITQMVLDGDFSVESPWTNGIAKLKT